MFRNFSRIFHRIDIFLISLGDVMLQGINEMVFFFMNIQRAGNNVQINQDEDNSSTQNSQVSLKNEPQ